MAKLTVDYLIPTTVAVDTDTGNVLDVWLHADSFQVRPGPPDAEPWKLTPVEVFAGSSDEHQRDELPEYLPPDHPLFTRALEIAERVTLTPAEFQPRYIVEAA